jgi:hypothetical protein
MYEVVNMADRRRTIVEHELDEQDYRRLKIRAATEGISVKRAVTLAIKMWLESPLDQPSSSRKRRNSRS